MNKFINEIEKLNEDLVNNNVVRDQKALQKLKEADLKKHLEVELDKDNGVKKDKIKPKDKKNITKEDIEKDNQLNTGIGILKSLIIIKK